MCLYECECNDLNCKYSTNDKTLPNTITNDEWERVRKYRGDACFIIHKDCFSSSPDYVLMADFGELLIVRHG